MADFSVPNYSDLIDNLNPQIAGGPPRMDFSGLERIPQSYYSGQKNQYDQRLRDLFKGGVPQNADGSTDYPGMMKSLLQSGGAPQIQSAIGLGNYQILRDEAGKSAPPLPGFPPSGSNMQPSAATGDPRGLRNNNPLNIESGNFTQSQGGYQGSDGRFAKFASLDDGVNAADHLLTSYGNRGLNTVSGIVNRWAPPGENDSQGYAATVAKTLGIDPNQQIDLTNPAVRKSIIGAMAQVENGRPLPQSPQAQPPLAQQSPTPTQNVPAQPTELQANMYEKRAEFFYQQAKVYGAAGNAASATAAEKQGEQAAQQALEIRKSLLKSAQPTTDMQNAQANNAANPRANAANMEQDKLNIADFGKQNTALQGTGQKAANAISDAQLLKGATLDQKFYSGPLNEYVKTFRQFQSIFGNNPGDAAPMEAFNKVATNMLTDQIKGLAQSGVGRVLMAEVNNMKQGIASLGITPLTNRALAEFTIRAATQNRDLAEIAQKIDDTVPPAQKKAALNQAVMEYQKRQPLFSDHEKQDPRLLGAPDAPPESLNWSPQQARMYWQQHGLKPGAPIRIRMGIYGQVP